MNKLLIFNQEKSKGKLHKKKKRHLTLIEVLIAFSIVVMSIFPLLYPHVFIFRQQSVYTQKIEMNHAVNLMFTDIYRQLYQQEIPLRSVIEEGEFPVDEVFLKKAGFTDRPAFAGTYRFHLAKRKASDDKSQVAYLVELIFDLHLKGDASEKNYPFIYTLFVYQETEQSAAEEEIDEN